MLITPLMCWASSYFGGGCRSRRCDWHLSLTRSFGLLLSVSWILCCSSWCPPGLAPSGWLSGLLTNWAKYLTCINSSILSFRAKQSSVLWPILWWYLQYLIMSDPTYEVLSGVARWVPLGWKLPPESWCDWSLGVCNARTSALLGEVGVCLACASCPTYVSRPWCLLCACWAFVWVGGPHSRIWTFLPSGCSPWHIRATRSCYRVDFCTYCLWTCRGVRWGAWNATLPQGRDFGFGWLCAQICPWIFWGTRCLLVVD